MGYIVHGVTESDTMEHTHTHTHTHNASHTDGFLNLSRGENSGSYKGK